MKDSLRHRHFQAFRLKRSALRPLLSPPLFFFKARCMGGKANFEASDDLNNIEVILTSIDGGLFGLLSLVLIYRYMHSLVFRNMRPHTPSMVLLGGFVLQAIARTSNLVYAAATRNMMNWFLILPTLFHMFTMAYFIMIWGNYTSSLRLAYGLQPTRYQFVMALIALAAAAGCLAVWVVLWIPVGDGASTVLSQVDSGLDLGGCTITGVVLLVMSSDLKKVFKLAGVEDGGFNPQAGLDHTQALQRDRERMAKIREGLEKERRARRRREQKERRARAAEKRLAGADRQPNDNTSLASRPDEQQQEQQQPSPHGQQQQSTPVSSNRESTTLTESVDPTLFGTSESKINESENFRADEYDLLNDRLEVTGSGPSRGSSVSWWSEWTALFAMENRHWRIALGMRIFGIYSVLRGFLGVGFIVGGSVTRLMYTGFGFYTFEFIFLSLSLSVLVGPPEEGGDEEGAEEKDKEEHIRQVGDSSRDERQRLLVYNSAAPTVDDDAASTTTGSSHYQAKTSSNPRTTGGGGAVTSSLTNSPSLAPSTCTTAGESNSRWLQQQDTTVICMRTSTTSDRMDTLNAAAACGGVSPPSKRLSSMSLQDSHGGAASQRSLSGLNSSRRQPSVIVASAEGKPSSSVTGRRRRDISSYRKNPSGLNNTHSPAE